MCARYPDPICLYAGVKINRKNIWSREGGPFPKTTSGCFRHKEAPTELNWVGALSRRSIPGYTRGVVVLKEVQSSSRTSRVRVFGVRRCPYKTVVLRRAVSEIDCNFKIPRKKATANFIGRQSRNSTAEMIYFCLREHDSISLH